MSREKSSVTGVNPVEGQGDNLARQASRRSSHSKRRQPKWWKVRLFRGMINDVKARAPYYWSDWKDAWDYRVVPATIYMYFAKYGFFGKKIFLLSASLTPSPCFFTLLPWPSSPLSTPSPLLHVFKVLCPLSIIHRPTSYCFLTAFFLAGHFLSLPTPCLLFEALSFA